MKTSPTDKNVLRAREIGRKTALNMSNEFWITHPEYRGQKLTLDNFPSMVARHGALQVLMSFPDQTRGFKTLERVATIAARKAAVGWIKENRHRIKGLKREYKSIYTRAFDTKQTWYKIATVPSTAVDKTISAHVLRSPWFEFLVVPKKSGTSLG